MASYDASATDGSRTASPNVDGMFSGTTSLAKLAAGNNAKFEGSGLSDPFGSGAWKASTNSWLGSAADIMRRYTTNGYKTNSWGVVTYTYDTAAVGGAFVSNPACWWEFDSNTGTLTIHYGEGFNNNSKIVTEAGNESATGTTLPWQSKLGKGNIYIVRFAGGIQPTTLYEWFNGNNQKNSAIKEFHGANLDTSQCTNFFAFLWGLPQLSVIDGIANWDVHKVTDFRYVFGGSFALTELDISGWDMASYDASATDGSRTASPNVGSMFSGKTGTTKLTKLVVGNNAKLEGSELSDPSSTGAWKTSNNSWFGGAADIMRRYTADAYKTNSWGVVTYIWDSSFSAGAFASNNDAWWRFDPETHTLTIGISDGATNKKVTEAGNESATGATLPWQSKLGKGSIYIVRFAGGIQPTTLYEWFNGNNQKNSAIKEFHGANLDTSQCTNFFAFLWGLPQLSVIDGIANWDVHKVTDFRYVFGGNFALTELDISGWDMASYDASATDGSRTASPNVGCMFSGKTGTTKLTKLVVGNNAKLEGSELSDPSSTGAWKTSNNSWFGSAADIMRRYTAEAYKTNSWGVLTYIWDSSFSAGHFASNNDAWWRFDPETHTLTIGISDGATNKKVTEAGNESATGTTLPWQSKLGKGSIYIVRFAGGIQPTTLYEWFNGNNQKNSAIKEFHGANLDTSQCTSLYAFLWGLPQLSVIDGIANWDVRKVTDFAYAFGGNFALTELDISGWDMASYDASATDGSRTASPNVGSMFSGKTGTTKLTKLVVGNNAKLEGSELSDPYSVGAWKASTNSWLGSAADIMRRYTADAYKTNSWGVVTYTYDAAVVGGAFVSNPACWWEFDSNTGTLTIHGAEGFNNNSKIVTEAGNESATDVTLPWQSKLGKGKIYIVRFAGGIQPTTLYDWFNGKNQTNSAIKEFHGANLDTSQCTIFFGFLWGLPQLSVVDGIADWDVRKVTDFRYTFGGNPALTELDISGWDMSTIYSNATQGRTSVATVTSMLIDLDGLTSITLGPKNVIAGAELTTSTTHATTVQGAWRTASGMSGWFGDSADLAARFPASGNPAVAVATYTWDTSFSAGHFASNSDVWWYFDPETHTLTIGISDDATNKKVTEAGNESATDVTLPWQSKLGKGKIYIVRFAGGIQPTTLYDWFNGKNQTNSAIKEFHGANLDTSQCTIFFGFLWGLPQLSVVDGIADWDVRKVTDFRYTFGGNPALTELDISGWDMSTIYSNAAQGRTSAAAVAHMFENMPSLTKLTVGNGVILQGTNLDSNVAINESMGLWTTSAGYSGATSALVALYTNQGNTLGKTTYTFVKNSPHEQTGTFANTNVWWKFDYVTGALTIGTSGGSSNYVTESGSSLPWLVAGVDPSLIHSVNVSGNVVAKSLASWFANNTTLKRAELDGLKLSDGTNYTTSLNGLFYNCSSLTTISGISSWDTSHVTDFTNAFNGCSALTSLDISGWDMTTTGGTRTNMLLSLTNLKSLTLGNKIRLDGTGLQNIPALANGQGYWQSGSWKASTSFLMSCYPAAGNSFGNLTYTWHDEPGVIRYRYPQNDNCWWTFDATTGTLTIGADDGSDKYIASGDIHPWQSVVASGAIKHIKTQGGIQFYSTKNMFFFERSPSYYQGHRYYNYGGAIDYLRYYQNVVDFDGSGMDMSRTTDMSGMFAYMANLKTITGISNWDVSKVTTFSSDWGLWNAGSYVPDNGSPAQKGAFYGCVSLAELDISGWDMSAATANTNLLAYCTSLKKLTVGSGCVLANSGISSNSGYGAQNGSWYCEAKNWRGASANLESRYSGTSNPQETLTYVWQEGTIGGRYPQNDNCWWTFDATTGTLTIGADEDAADKYIASGDIHPWHSVVAPSAIKHIKTQGGIQFYSTKNMFLNVGSIENWSGDLVYNWASNGNLIKYYQNVVDFDGSGMDMSRTTDMSGMFAYCTGLKNITGISNWDVSKVTTFSSRWRTVNVNSPDPKSGNQKHHGPFDWCTSLEELDISGWDMSAATANTNLLAGCTSLKKLTVGSGCVLANSGISSNSGYGAQNGSWYCEAKNWRGASANLESRYSGTSNPQETLTYVWQEGTIGGRYPQNDNCWWTFDATTGTLTIGADEDAADKYIASGDIHPWHSVVAPSAIKHIKTQGGIQFYSTKNMFFFERSPSYYQGHRYYNYGGAIDYLRYYQNVVDFDGSGMDMSRTTDMSGMFAYMANLKTITGISNWDVSKVTTFSSKWRTANVNSPDPKSGNQKHHGPFDWCTSLEELDISGWDMSAATANTNLLAGCSSLKKLVSGSKCVLINSDLPGVANAPGRYKLTLVSDDSDLQVGQIVSPSTLCSFYSELASGEDNGHGTATWEWVRGTTIHFNPNASGTLGSMPDIFLERGEAYTLPTQDPDATVDNYDHNVFFRDGYWLRWWNTKASAPGQNRDTEYEAGSEFYAPDLTSEITLYAVWVRRVKAIAIFEPGSEDNVSGTTDSILDKWAGDDIVVSDNGYTRVGYDFIGWLLQVDNKYHYPQESYQLTDTQKYEGVWTNPETGESFQVVYHRFVAQWKQKSGFSLDYDLKGGSIAYNGSTVKTLPSKTNISWESTNLLPSGTPTRKGYTFDGWYYTLNDQNYKASNNTRYRDIAELNDNINAGLILWALWSEAPVGLTFESANSSQGLVYNPATDADVTNFFEQVDSLSGISQGSTAHAKTGYHFAYWLESRTNTRIYTAILTGAQVKGVAYINGIYVSTTFTAFFEPNTYTVHYDLNGATGSLDDQSFTYNKADYLAKATGTISRKGYAFVNWNTVKTPRAIIPEPAIKMLLGSQT